MQHFACSAECAVDCVISENAHLKDSKGDGRLKRQNFLKESMKLNWNYQRGGRAQTKQPSMGGVWVLSDKTQDIIWQMCNQSNP